MLYVKMKGLYMETPITNVNVNNLKLVKCIINTAMLDGIEAYQNSTYVGTFDIELMCDCGGVAFTIKKTDVKFTYDHNGLGTFWRDTIASNIIDNLKNYAL